MTVKLVDLNNTGPELLKYKKVIAAINIALDEAANNMREATSTLELIDYYLFGYGLSTYTKTSKIATRKFQQHFDRTDVTYEKDFTVAEMANYLETTLKCDISYTTLLNWMVKRKFIRRLKHGYKAYKFYVDQDVLENKKELNTDEVSYKVIIKLKGKTWIEKAYVEDIRGDIR